MCQPIDLGQSQDRCKLWIESMSVPDSFVVPVECLPLDHGLPWPTWRSLNRLRTQVGQSKEITSKWGFADGDNLNSLCGKTKIMSYLVSCPVCPDTCTREDLMAATDNAVKLTDLTDQTDC